MWRNQFEEKKMNSLEGKVALVTGRHGESARQSRSGLRPDGAAVAGDQALNRRRKTRT
jgi:hypothetical protein